MAETDQPRPVTTRDLAVFSAYLGRMLLGRAVAGQTAYEGDRDYYKSLGYPTAITIQQYVTRYERQDIAGRVVDLPALDTWRRPPPVTEGDGQTDTEFVKAWEALAERLRVWNYLSRADRLSGIGRFGVLLVGVRGGGNGEDDGRGPLATPVEEGKLKSPKDILYLRPFSEAQATVKRFEEDANNPRYGLPTEYDIQLRQDRGTLPVHWTRVLHLADGKRDSEVFGTPRLERVFNRLDDLIKVVGGASEAAWLLMRPGTLLTTKEGFKFGDDTDTADQIDEEIFRYLHDPARFLRLEGAEAHQIGPSETPVIDSLFNAAIGLIAAASGIPQRVLLGSAKGELAAAKEDMRQWAGEIATRQKTYAEPEILRPFVARLQWYGALPPTPEGYNVGVADEDGEHHWPSILQSTPEEQAGIADRRASAVQRLVDPLTGEFPLTKPEQRELLGYPARPLGEEADLEGEEEEVGLPPDMAANLMTLRALGADDADLGVHQASHVPQLTHHVCPLCGNDKAYRYDGHGPLLLCTACLRTYDPEVE